VWGGGGTEWGQGRTGAVFPGTKAGPEPGWWPGAQSERMRRREDGRPAHAWCIFLAQLAPH